MRSPCSLSVYPYVRPFVCVCVCFCPSVYQSVSSIIVFRRLLKLLSYAPAHRFCWEAYKIALLSVSVFVYVCPSVCVPPNLCLRLMRSPCCLCVCPLPNFSFSTRSVTYHTKSSDYFFPELLLQCMNYSYI
jgi:hypothetical protein